MDDETEQTVTDALIDQIESAARASFRRHQGSIKGQMLTAADNYDWHLLHAAYQAGVLTMRAENESLREQRNRIGLYIGHALSGGKKDNHEACLSERMNAIRALIAERNEWQAARIAYANEFPLNADGEPDVVNVHANIRSLKAQLAECAAGREIERLRDWATSPLSAPVAHKE